MPWRVTHALIALIVAFAATVSAGMGAMPMRANAAEVVQDGCQACPHMRTTPNPGNMPGCQVLACASVVAVLPTPEPLPRRTLLSAVYLVAPPVHWTEAPAAPDPFPPKASVPI